MYENDKQVCESLDMPEWTECLEDFTELILLCTEIQISELIELSKRYEELKQSKTYKPTRELDETKKALERKMESLRQCLAELMWALEEISPGIISGSKRKH